MDPVDEGGTQRASNHNPEPIRRRPRRRPDPPPRNLWGRIKRWLGAEKKTPWDLLQLLIVPMFLTVLGLWFTAQQDDNRQRIEESRAQNAALQGYLDEMRRLVLEADLFRPETTTEVKAQKPGEAGTFYSVPEVNLLARARTLAVLETLGPTQKRSVVQFLVESNLIDRGYDLEGDPDDLEKPHHDQPYVNLDGANLSGAELKDLCFTVPT